jgi:hypothetical protein
MALKTEELFYFTAWAKMCIQASIAIFGRISGMEIHAFDCRAGLPDGLFSNQKSQFG